MPSTVRLVNLAPAGAPNIAAGRDAERWRSLAMKVVAVMATMSRERSFMEHLDELRKRLIWSLCFVAVAFAACWVFADDLYEMASAPLRANPAVTLSVSRLQDILALQVKVTLGLDLRVVPVCARPGLDVHRARPVCP